MSQQRQHQNFDLNFVKETMCEWKKLSHLYGQQAEKVYIRLRSYLTLYQFRLSDQQKSDIREMLSQDLDALENPLIEDFDNFLDGYCFKLDKTLLPKKQPAEVKIQIAPEQKLPELKYEDLATHAPIKPTAFDTLDSAYSNPQPSPVNDNALDLDYFEMMFYQ